MADTWDHLGSHGKRGRNDESNEEKSSLPAPAPGLSGCNKKPALEGAIEPKDLGKLMEQEPVLQPEAGEPGKNMEISGASGASALQLSQTAAEAVALLRGPTEKEQMENILGGLTKEQMLEFGYDLDTANEFCASVAAAPKEKPVLVLSLQGKFNINVFSEELHKNLAKPEGADGQPGERDRQGGHLRADRHQRLQEVRGTVLTV